MKKLIGMVIVMMALYGLGLLTVRAGATTAVLLGSSFLSLAVVLGVVIFGAALGLGMIKVLNKRLGS